MMDSPGIGGDFDRWIGFTTNWKGMNGSKLSWVSEESMWRHKKLCYFILHIHVVKMAIYPPSYTHEVKSFDVTFHYTMLKSISHGFIKCTSHSCVRCYTHVVSNVANRTERDFIYSKYHISICIFNLSAVSYYLFIQSIGMWCAEVETMAFNCNSKKIIIWGPFFAVWSLIKL